jgi:hypothetical protein
MGLSKMEAMATEWVMSSLQWLQVALFKKRDRKRRLDALHSIIPWNFCYHMC